MRRRDASRRSRKAGFEQPVAAAPDIDVVLIVGATDAITEPVGKRTACLQRNRSISIFALLLVCGFMGCSKPDAPLPAPPPAPPPTITQATFEPVYRASKAIQGATGPGVTYPKFGELLQGLSTEIGIAKDHQMNGLDRKLIALYEEALATYNFSAELWKVKLQAHEVYEGEIPVVKVIGGKGRRQTSFNGAADVRPRKYPVRQGALVNMCLLQ